MPFIDLHCDTAGSIYYGREELYSNPYHIDIKKLKQSKYLAQWFAFFINTVAIGDASPMAEFEKMYDYFVEQVGQNTNEMSIVTTYEEYIKAKAEDKIGAFLSIEEGQIIQGDLSNVDQLEQKGIRLMTLTWNYANSLGYPHSINQGLTKLGKELVEYLNHKKMLIDIAHLSKKGMDDVIALYKKPIIASHSNAKGLYEHTRNLEDETIRAIANSGGVVGVNFYSYFLTNSNTTRVIDIINMIDYLYKVGGEDILALGTDFDGIDCQLEVCNCSELDKLIAGLAERYPSRVIDKFSYLNVERLLKENL